MQRDVGKSGCHLLLQTPVTVVVALDNVNRTGEFLRYLRDDKRRYQIAAVQQDAGAGFICGGQRLSQIPDVIMAVGQDGNFHQYSPVAGEIASLRRPLKEEARRSGPKATTVHTGNGAGSLSTLVRYASSISDSYDVGNG